MKVLNLDINSNYEGISPAVLAMGMFDGLHLGHVKLITTAVFLSEKLSDEKKSGSAVLTFDVPPKKIFSKGQFAGKILSDDVKFEITKQLGVNITYLMKFTQEIFSMSADKFFYEIIKAKIDPKCIVVGFNYTFGKGKSGNVETLEKLCKQSDIELKIVEPVSLEDEIVSTTIIKSAILAKDIRKVSAFLGRPYEVMAKVIQTDPFLLAKVSEDLIMLPEETYEIVIEGKVHFCTVKSDNLIEIRESGLHKSGDFIKIEFI